MKCTIPEISWHNRDPVLSVDIQPKLESDKNEFYRLASGGTDSHVLIWHMRINETGSINLDLVADLARHQKAVNCVKWSPNGELLASSDDESVIFIWRQKGESETLNICDTANEHDKETWATMKILRGHLDDIYDLSWSPSSTLLLSGSVDNTAVVWDVYKGKSLYTLADHKGFVQGVAWDPLNQYIATLSTDRSTRLFKVNSTYCTKRSATSKTDVHLIVNNTFFSNIKTTKKIRHLRFDFSPDGKYLIAPSILNSPPTSTFHLYDIKSSLEILKSSFTTPNIRQSTFVARFCPLIFKRKRWIMKRMIYAISTETSVYIYDSTSKKPLYEYQDIHKQCITDMSWSNDGRILAISSQDGYCSFILFSEKDFEELYIGIEMKSRSYQDESLEIEDCIDKIQPKVRSLNLTCTENDKKFILKQHDNISDQTELQANNQTTGNINENYEAPKNPIFLEQSKLEDQYKCFLQPKNCKKKYIFEEQDIYLKEKYSKLCTNYNPSKDIFGILNPTENQNFKVMSQHGNIPDHTVTQDEEETNENINEINISDEADCNKKSVKESEEFDLIGLSTPRHQHGIKETETENNQSYETQYTDRNSDKDYEDIPITFCQKLESLRQQQVGQKQKNLDHENYILNQFEISKEINRIREYRTKGRDKYTNFMKSLNKNYSFIPTSSNIPKFVVLNNYDNIPDQTVPQVVEMTNENINETSDEIVDVEGISLESPVSSDLTNLSNQNHQSITIEPEPETENYQSYGAQSTDKSTIGDYRNNPSTSKQSVVNEVLDIFSIKSQILCILLKHFDSYKKNNKSYLKEKNQKKNVSFQNPTRTKSVIVMNPYYRTPSDQTVPQDGSTNRKKTIPTDEVKEYGKENWPSDDTQSMDRNSVENFRNIPSSSSYGQNYLPEFLDNFIPIYPTGMNEEELARIVVEEYQSFISQFTENNSGLQEQNPEMAQQYAEQQQIIINETLQSLMEEADREHNNNKEKIRTENSHSHAPLSIDRNLVKDYRNIPSTSRNFEEYMAEICMNEEQQQNIRIENLAENSHFHAPQFTDRNSVEFEDYRNIPSTSRYTVESSQRVILGGNVVQPQIIIDEQQQIVPKKGHERNNNDETSRIENVAENSDSHPSQTTDRNSDEDDRYIPTTSRHEEELARRNFLMLMMAQDQIVMDENTQLLREEYQECNNNEENIRTENVVKYSHTHASHSTDRNPAEDYRDIPSTSRQAEELAQRNLLVLVMAQDQIATDEEQPMVQVEEEEEKEEEDYIDIRNIPGPSWQTPEDLRQQHKKKETSTCHQQVSNRNVTHQQIYLDDDQIDIQKTYKTSIEEQQLLVALYQKERYEEKHKEKDKDPKDPKKTYTKLRESSEISFDNLIIKLSPEGISAELNKIQSNIDSESIQNRPTDSIYTDAGQSSEETQRNIDNASMTISENPTIPPTISEINMDNPNCINRKRKLCVRDDIFDSKIITSQNSNLMLPFNNDTEPKVEDVKVCVKSRFSSDSPPTSLDEEHIDCKKSKDHIQDNPIKSDNNDNGDECHENYINRDTNNDDIDNYSNNDDNVVNLDTTSSNSVITIDDTDNNGSTSENSDKRSSKSKKKNRSTCKPYQDYRDDRETESDSDSNSKFTNYEHGSVIRKHASLSTKNGENVGTSAKCKKLENNSQTNNDDNDENFNEDQNETIFDKFRYHSEPSNYCRSNKEYIKYIFKNFFVSNKQFSRKSFNLFPSKDHKDTKSFLHSDSNTINIFNDDKNGEESIDRSPSIDSSPVMSKEKFTGDQIVPEVSSNQNEDSYDIQNSSGLSNESDLDETVIFSCDGLINMNDNVEKCMENDQDIANLSKNKELSENFTSENVNSDPTIISLDENRNDSIESEVNEFVLELLDNAPTTTNNMEDTNQQHVNGPTNADKKQMKKDNDPSENTGNKEKSSGNLKNSSLGNCAGSNDDDDEDRDRNSNTVSNDVEEENYASEDDPIKESINTYDVTYTYTYERFHEVSIPISNNAFIHRIKEIPGILHIGRIYRNRSGDVVRMDYNHYHSETGVIEEDIIGRNRNDNIQQMSSTDIITSLNESFSHTVSNVEMENDVVNQQDQFYSQVEYENNRVFRIENSNNIQDYVISEEPGSFTITTTYTTRNGIPIGTINTILDSIPIGNASIPSDILVLGNRLQGLTLPTTITLISNERTQRMQLMDVDPLDASECNYCSKKHIYLIRDRFVEENTDLQHFKRKIIIGHLSRLITSNNCGYLNIWIFIMHLYEFLILYNLFCKILIVILYGQTNSLNVQNYDDNHSYSSAEMKGEGCKENEVIPNEKNLCQNNAKCEPEDVLLSINPNVEGGLDCKPNEKINNKSDTNESFSDDNLDNTGASSNNKINDSFKNNEFDENSECEL